MFYILSIIILIIIDQFTKYLVNTNFQIGDTVAIIQNFFHITYVENCGVAFGLFQGKLNLINILTIGISIVIIFILLKKNKTLKKIEKLSFILILSGALGNIIDRIFRGFVVDMLDFRGIWKFVFNFADVYINIGIFLLIFDCILTEIKKEK